jgi:hypothetical protein
MTKGIKGARLAGHSVERVAIEKATGNLIFYLAGDKSVALKASQAAQEDENEWDGVTG